MKLANSDLRELGAVVVPRAGTWIETTSADRMYHRGGVVPRAGTWIETRQTCRKYSKHLSFPVRERGLKQLLQKGGADPDDVVPRAGTWIETYKWLQSLKEIVSRSPCGNVD